MCGNEICDAEKVRSKRVRGRKNPLRGLGGHFVNLIALSVLTGLFSGTVVTLYNILTGIGEEQSVTLYTLIVENPAYIPLLFLGLFAGALIIGTITRLIPILRGSGVPQIEGAARGLLHFKWYVVMCSMFAVSLACVFMGLPAGSEGPSLEIGGCAGDGVASSFRRSLMVRRLQIAAGSAAGLAAAFNAPVTGLSFAMEEAFRSFSAQVFTCSAISVVVSLLVRNLLRWAILFPAMDIADVFGSPTFTAFDFATVEPIGYLYTLIAALAAGLLGVAFYHLMLLTRKGLAKITFLKGAGKYVAPFMVAGAFGLISVYAMGGGHEFIESLGSLHEGEFKTIFGLSLAATLAIVVLMRFISTILAVGAGMPYGIFVPVLATGAGLGALLCCAFRAMGMSPELSDYIIIITMAAYFATVVRAPVTALIMVVEFTGQFQNLLPSLIGVGIGFIVGELFRTESVFEKCLDFIVKEQNVKQGATKRRVTLTVEEGSYADGRAIRSVLWPAGGMVVEVTPSSGERFVPDGKTRLSAGDSITFECVASSEEDVKNYLSDIVCGDE
ncbi:MAG TPA: chloride channel protein [Candidatus Coproplasma excrementigallinarum]|uniref:Chloride channel protein n=1 Tax=Candidatus Coproplasma excrementigallinarum TaxID=2840747 RepID=A0A9D1MKD3_9FIRM|nr:chloride channel protein [Candidatus Coproplasma excrementigallinarum]